MEYNLTKEADALLCLLYGKYRMKLKDDEDDSDPTDLGSIDNIHEIMSGKLSRKETVAYVNELVSKGLIHSISADSEIVFAELTPSAIEYAEAKGKGKLISSIKTFVELTAAAVQIISFIQMNL